MAATLSQHRFHTLLEGGFFLSGHIGLDRAGKAAAVYADCTVSTEQMLGQSDRHGHCLLLRLRSTVQILQQLRGRCARTPHQSKEGIDLPLCQAVRFLLCIAVISKKMHGT